MRVSPRVRSQVKDLPSIQNLVAARAMNPCFAPETPLRDITVEIDDVVTSTGTRLSLADKWRGLQPNVRLVEHAIPASPEMSTPDRPRVVS